MATDGQAAVVGKLEEQLGRVANDSPELLTSTTMGQQPLSPI